MRYLIALAVLAIAVPAAADAKSSSCVKPLKGWRTTADGYPSQYALNWVTLRSGLILWNNAAIGEEQLLENLGLARQSNPVAFVIFDPRSADCDFARRIQAMIDQNYPCRQRACIQWNPKDPIGR